MNAPVRVFQLKQTTGYKNMLHAKPLQCQQSRTHKALIVVVIFQIDVTISRGRKISVYIKALICKYEMGHLYPKM